MVNLNFPPQSFAQVLVGWQNWLRTADRNSWALADSTTDAMGTHCRIMATCPAGSGNSVGSAILSAVGMQPTGTENHTFNYFDLVRYLAVGNLNPSPLGYVGGSDVFTTITPAAAQGIASVVDAFPRGAGRMLAIMHALDGALATVAPGATAFPWRRQFALTFVGMTVELSFNVQRGEPAESFYTTTTRSASITLPLWARSRKEVDRFHREFLIRRDVPVLMNQRSTRSTGLAITPCCSSTTRSMGSFGAGVGTESSHSPTSLVVLSCASCSCEESARSAKVPGVPGRRGELCRPDKRHNALHFGKQCSEKCGGVPL